MKKNYSRRFVLIFLHFTVFICVCRPQPEPVLSGLDVLKKDQFELISGKRLGIITDQTSVSSEGIHLLEMLDQIHSIHVSAIVTFEKHRLPKLIHTEPSSDSANIPVIILFDDLIQRNDMLTLPIWQNIDLFLFDLQDTGTRLSPSIQVLTTIMNIAIRNRIKIILLDRPNIMTGVIIEGPVAQQMPHSTIAPVLPVPIRHGMTIGELALMIEGEEWLENSRNLNINIVPLKNWRRIQWYDQTSLPFVKPSSNIHDLTTVLFSSGMELLAGTNLSYGAGTNNTYTLMGSPWFNTGLVRPELPSTLTFSIDFQTIQFTPIQVDTVPPPYVSEVCNGFRFTVYNRDIFRPVSLPIYLLCAIQKTQPEKLQFNHQFDQLIGNSNVRKQILNGIPGKEIISGWHEGIKMFKTIRKNYLLYPE